MTTPQQNRRTEIHSDGRTILRMMLLGTSKLCLIELAGVRASMCSGMKTLMNLQAIGDKEQCEGRVVHQPLEFQVGRQPRDVCVTNVATIDESDAANKFGQSDVLLFVKFPDLRPTASMAMILTDRGRKAKEPVEYQPCAKS